MLPLSVPFVLEQTTGVCVESSDTSFRATLDLLSEENDEVSGGFDINPSWLIFDNN